MWWQAAGSRTIVINRVLVVLAGHYLLDKNHLLRHWPKIGAGGGGWGDGKWPLVKKRRYAYIRFVYTLCLLW
jgi:hypothetical protein